MKTNPLLSEYNKNRKNPARYIDIWVKIANLRIFDNLIKIVIIKVFIYMMPSMGKVKAAVTTGALRVGNTIATPVRRWGEVANALVNVLRQWKSSAKNTAEVGKQTIDALVDNFLNFSKVDGKWYQKLLKGSVNLASAVTRRPAMIAGAWVLSAMNQWLWKPFKKLAPGKLFKGLGNATRLFSKKKWFDFAKYDTDDTKGDTWVNQITEKRKWFFGKGWSSEKPVEAKKEVKKEEPKKIEEPKKEEKPIEAKKEEPKKEEKPVEVKKVEDKPKSIDDLKKKNTEEAAEKDKEEQEERKWKNIDPKFKVQYNKEYKKMLNDKSTKEWVIERGKKTKKWENIEEIISTLKKDDNIEFSSYIEDEILKKAA